MRCNVAGETDSPMSKRKAGMPITQAVDAVLHRGEPALAVVERLLSRDPKVESV